MKISGLLVCWIYFVVSTGSLQAQVKFDDRSWESRIHHLGSNHGVSFGDFNNDGLEDIYVAVREEEAPNKLYLNLGQAIFEEIGVNAGVDDMASSTAAVWGDIDNDGWPDLYVGNAHAPNRLYWNKGDHTFEDITLSAEVGDAADARSVQFVDIDNDSYLDIYVHNYNTENVMYRNNGDRTFEDFTLESGALNIDQAMGTIFFDLDNDGDQDLYAVNDGRSNVAFVNDGTGRFTDISEQSGLNIKCFCMGVDIGDYNQDGWFDIYISNYGINFLLENNGDGTFSEKAEGKGVADRGMGWGTFFFDYDNDGHQDIYLANNFFISSRPNIIFRNTPGSAFEIVSDRTNLVSPYSSFGSASADVNNDGLQDIFVANWGTTTSNQLFINQHEENNHSIQVKAIGTISNRSAIGTKVTVRTGDRVQIDQVTGATGYASQNSFTLHFGIGQANQVDQLTIQWPSGLEETYHDLGVNRHFTVTEDEGMESKVYSSFEVLSTPQEEVSLLPSYPNPFATSTFIPFQLNVPQQVMLEVYAIDGRKLVTLLDREMSAGQHEVEWNGQDRFGHLMANGLYSYKLRTDRAVWSGKLFLMR